MSAFTMTRYLDRYERSRIILINVTSTKKVYRADDDETTTTITPLYTCAFTMKRYLDRCVSPAIRGQIHPQKHVS